MAGLDLVLVTALVGLGLAVSALLWGASLRHKLSVRVSELAAQRDRAQIALRSRDTAMAAFESAVLSIRDHEARLVFGEAGLIHCAQSLGLDTVAQIPDAQSLLSALSAASPDGGEALEALFTSGQACQFEVQGPSGVIAVEGRITGAMAWLRLTPVARAQMALPTAARFAALLDDQDFPVWMTHKDASLAWGNRAWLAAADAQDLGDAAKRNLALDLETETHIAKAAEAGEAHSALRWITLAGQRRALGISARPMPGGGMGVLGLDMTEAETLREALKRHIAAHDQTLDHLADAVAIFSPDKRLSFHNTAFAQLWGLEPAWLAERPSHGEVLDRLRRRRRLPETVDYSQWRAEELRHYEALEASPDELWTLPDGRTLRIVRQPHPLGGLLLLYSDITDEMRLKTQYNAQIQVQQATLDKLSDAVAVFGSDGRLRLHNEAFETFWNLTSARLAAAGDFDGVVELCVPKLHDQQFWREMKGRVADPDPQARIAVSGEAKTSDGRIIAYQSRPLPDGATLIAFADVTDARRLERALADRSSALEEAERLKRDFVGNVSYELRTPLTTIIGYSELLTQGGEVLPPRAQGYVGWVLAAAIQLARSIDNVLDMALMDAGELSLDLGDVRVDTLLEETRERWRSQAEGEGLKIAIDCPGNIGLIRADMTRLQEVLDHLVENALRQTPTGGVITLAAARALGEVQIQVADTGRGIPFQVQAHIFDRFVGRDRGGPGLGLALVKALVELHGGWVALESEPGQGAVFTCHLPEIAGSGTRQKELGF